MISKEAMRVCVVMPTYNGGELVKQQITSILEQTYEHIDIYVRDDGSSDNTVEVVRSLIEENHSTKQLFLVEDGMGNLGFPETFYATIRTHPTYPCYFFSDQDDIWLPNKVERAVNALLGHEDEPTVYFSSFEYRYANGTFIRKAPDQPKEVPFWRTLLYTPGLGFTIAFNQEACRRFILEANTGEEMHDRWMLRCAAGFGTLLYDDEVTAWHLRHEEAVTAADRRPIDLVRGFMKSELAGDDAVREKERLAFFFEEYSERLTPRQRRVCRTITSNSKTPLTWIRKVTIPHRLRSTMGGEVALRLLFLLGKI